MTSDPQLAAQLRAIVDENLGWLSVTDLEPGQREEFRRVVSEGLAVKANGEWPAGLTERAAALERIGALARAVSTSGD